VGRAGPTTLDVYADLFDEDLDGVAANSDEGIRSAAHPLGADHTPPPAAACRSDRIRPIRICKVTSKVLCIVYHVAHQLISRLSGLGITGRVRNKPGRLRIGCLFSVDVAVGRVPPMIYNEASKPTALLFGANGNTFLFVSSTTLSARLRTTLRLLRRPQSDFGDPRQCPEPVRALDGRGTALKWPCHRHSGATSSRHRRSTNLHH
jgi:hypothetical protein